MKEFPDWVLKHKKKGTNIILKNNNYYLYRVHSERRPDKKYPILITDEYLGRITEQGIISPKQKISKIIVKEYGLSNYYFTLISNQLNEWKIDDIISLSLLYTYDEINYDVFNISYLSILYPKYKIKNDLSDIYNAYEKQELIIATSVRNKLRSINKIIISNKIYDQNI